MKILVTGTLTLFLAAQQRLPSTLQISQRSEEHTSELQSPCNIVCRLLLDKKDIDIPQSRCGQLDARGHSVPVVDGRHTGQRHHSHHAQRVVAVERRDWNTGSSAAYVRRLR